MAAWNLARGVASQRGGRLEGRSERRPFLEGKARARCRGAAKAVQIHLIRSSDNADVAASAPHRPSRPATASARRCTPSLLHPRLPSIHHRHPTTHHRAKTRAAQRPRAIAPVGLACLRRRMPDFRVACGSALGRLSHPGPRHGAPWSRPKQRTGGSRMVLPLNRRQLGVKPGAPASLRHDRRLHRMILPSNLPTSQTDQEHRRDSPDVTA